MLTGRIKITIDHAGVSAKLNKWIKGHLDRIGAYTRGIMRNQIRPPLKRNREDIIVSIAGRRGAINCIVPLHGLVRDARTLEPVKTSLANDARETAARLRRGKGNGEGKPPRRGPTDKLRQGIIFITDMPNQSVVIGPRPFARQPQMLNRKTVPELLNKGGVEIVFGEAVEYGPRPYIETMINPAMAKLRDNIRKKPVSNRL